MTRPTYGSLFTGVGGMDMGFDTHMDCVFQVEWDKHCQGVLRRHWPDVPKWSDVCDVDGASLPPCDVLTFGSPCQDLSVAGKRTGLDGARSSMFYQAIRIIKEMRNATASRPTGALPRAVVWENVPGALSSNRGHDFRAVLDALADIGSHLTEWAVLDAQHYGIPQRRRRIFLVALFDLDLVARCPEPLLPVTEGRRGDYSKGQPSRQDIAGTLGGGSGSRGWSPDTDRMTFVPEKTLLPIPIQGTIIGRSDTAGPQGQGIGEPDGAMYTLDRVSMHGVAQPIPIQDGREMAKHQNGVGIGDEGTPAYTLDTTGAQAVAQPIIFENSYRDGARINDDISPTLPAKMGMGGGNQPHVTQHDTTAVGGYAVRRLSPLECERLMGWPDDHTRWTNTGEEQADTHRYKQCGNGVATPVARWVARHLNQLLNGDPT